MARTEERIDTERERLNQARVEAAAKRDALRREAEAERQRLLAETRDGADARLEKAQAELDESVAHERGTLEKSARTLAGQMVEKLLEKSA
jgi:F0F1-type ATP synthase membrane subunit b/b'